MVQGAPPGVPASLSVEDGDGPFDDHPATSKRAAARRAVGSSTQATAAVRALVLWKRAGFGQCSVAGLDWPVRLGGRRTPVGPVGPAQSGDVTGGRGGGGSGESQAPKAPPRPACEVGSDDPRRAHHHVPTANTHRITDRILPIVGPPAPARFSPPQLSREVTEAGANPRCGPLARWCQVSGASGAAPERSRAVGLPSRSAARSRARVLTASARLRGSSP